MADVTSMGRSSVPLGFGRQCPDEENVQRSGGSCVVNSVGIFVHSL